MNDTKETPWDSMFLKPEERAAAITPRDPQDKMDEDISKSHGPGPLLTHIDRALNFQENLEYIHDWDARQLLGLLIEGVRLHEVNFDYLDFWRKNYQVPPEQ